MAHRQARQAGLSDEQIRFRIRIGRWERILPGVYRICGVADSWDQRAWAAHLWAGPGSVLWGAAAARKLGLRGFDSAPVEVAVVGDKRHRDVPFKVHRCDEHLRDEVTLVDGLPVTSIKRTLLTLAGQRHPRARGAMDQALAEHLTSLEEMWLFHDQEWTRGRRGIAILRAWLRERTPGLAPTESELEDALWTIVHEAGLPLPLRQHAVVLPSGPIRFDLAYPHLRLAIEGDSYGWHGDRDAFERDRRRDAEAATAGWLVLRFTWAQIRFDRAYVATTIRANHARRLVA